MAGLSPKLPIALSEDDGIGLTKTYKEMVLQNFKNLLLTIPGERMMDPLFGIGLRTFLFEQDSSVASSNLGAKISQQTTKYLPYVDIINIDILSPGGVDPSLQASSDPHLLRVVITFNIIPLGSTAILDVNIS